jgi:hypothetical protein
VPMGILSSKMGFWIFASSLLIVIFILQLYITIFAKLLEGEGK